MLTESLHRHLSLGEAAEVVNAILNRRQTSHDVANLRQYLGAYLNKAEDANASS